MGHKSPYVFINSNPISMANAAKTQVYKMLENLRGSLVRSAVGLGSKPARWALVGLGVAFTVWQLYFFAWRPLREASELPPGVRAVPVQLDVETLQNVRDERSKRLQHTPNLFLEAGQYFVTESPSPPTGGGR